MTLTRNGDPVTVLLNGEPVTYLVPLEIVRTSGSTEDYARFLYNLDETGERIENMRTPSEFNALVEVKVTTDPGGENEDEVTIFRGKLHRQELSVGVDESVVVTASVKPQDYGKPVTGMTVWDKRSEEYKTLRGDILFNPLIDGEIRGTMSSLSDDGYRVWCHPDSVRTEKAETYRGETAELWEKDEAIHSLCSLLFTEAIEAPIVQDDPEIADAPLPLENVIIPFGTPVPDAIDMITHPLGLDWWLDPEGATSQVVVYRRGTGPEKTLTMQAVGETLDLDVTNNHRFQVSVDIGARVNKVHLVGARKQYEIGVELYRGWATADDALSLADLDASDPDSDARSKPNVWRLWVANEAGDYSGLRDSGANPIPDAPRDWSELGIVTEKTRPAEDCLTFGEDLYRLPPFLEWSNDGGSTWQPAPLDLWQWTHLETEFGVRFLGDTPPAELHAAGDNARLRLTATITSDECLEAKVASDDRDPEQDEPGDVWLILDVSDRYFYREVIILGDLKTHVWESGRDADEPDDTEAIESAAEQILLEVDAASITSRDLALIGIRADYKIGDLITEIAGRSISFDLRDETAAEPRYLQVVGLQWVFGDAQETRLITRPQMVDRNRPLRSDGVLHG